MALEMQFGDLATRIARAFRVKGRIPTKLDEMVVPVAVVEHLDRDPFRQEPISFSGAIVGITPAAGEHIVLGVRCVSGIVVLTCVATRPGFGDPDFFLNRQQTQNFDTFASLFALNRPGGVGGTLARPAALLVGDVVVGPLGGNAERVAAISANMSVFGTFEPLKWDAPPVLYPGDEFLLSLGDGVQQDATFWGLEFPPLV
jgi:hypothetical protein